MQPSGGVKESPPCSIALEPASCRRGGTEGFFKPGMVGGDGIEPPTSSV